MPVNQATAEILAATRGTLRSVNSRAHRLRADRPHHVDPCSAVTHLPDDGSVLLSTVPK